MSGFVDDADALRLMEIARARLAPAPVYSRESATGSPIEKTEIRSAHCCHLKEGEDEAVRRLRARASEVSGLPVDHLERVQILRYLPGEKYAPHYDWFNPPSPTEAQRPETVIQRVATIIVYLNDVEEGGETSFPKLNVRVRPRKGWAVHWRNCLPGSVEGDRRTLHAGEPVIRGEKWVAAIWARERSDPSVS